MTEVSITVRPSGQVLLSRLLLDPFHGASRIVIGNPKSTQNRRFQCLAFGVPRGIPKNSALWTVPGWHGR
jgi:hypothetical protein